MHSHLSENRAFHQYQEFCLDVDVVAEPWRLANQIDQVIRHAFATAEKHCSKTPKPPLVREATHGEFESALLEDSAYSQAHSGTTNHCPPQSRRRNLAGQTATNNARKHTDPEQLCTAAQRALHDVSGETQCTGTRTIPDRTQGQVSTPDIIENYQRRSWYYTY
jgi:hypothetical protein